VACRRPRILFFLANGQPLNIGGGVKHVLFSEDETIFDEHTFHMG